MNAVENTRAYEAMKYDFNESELVGLQYKPHPISLLIKERFSDEYDGKLTWREIELIREEMDKAENDLNNYRKEVDGKMDKIRDNIKEQRMFCRRDPTCLTNLHNHVKECVSKWKCTIYSVSNSCRIKYNINKECSHHRKIEDFERCLDNYRVGIYQFNSPFIDLQRKYERALAAKEDRLEEYESQLDADEFVEL